MLKNTLLLLAAVLLASRAMGADVVDKPQAVSLVQLLASPEKYDGKRVTVIAFLRLTLEGNVLFAHKDDYDNFISSDAIWVDPSPEMITDKDELNLKYVRIEGTFRSGQRGRSTGVGGIGDITRYSMWSDPAHPIRENMKKALSPATK